MKSTWRVVILIGGMVSNVALVSICCRMNDGAHAAEPASRTETGTVPASVTLPGPRVHSVVRSSSDREKLYSATVDGFFFSVNGGASWSHQSVGGGSDEVFSIAVHPADSGVLYVGRRDGLWTTVDAGRRWTPLTPPTPGPYIPLAVAIAPGQPDVIYTATARQGLYRSDDAGSSWRDASTGLPEAAAGGRPEEIRTLVVDPRAPDTSYFAHERHGVYRTTNGGATWRPFNEGLPLAAVDPVSSPRLAFDLDDPNRLYLLLDQRVHSHLVQNRLYVTSSSGRWVPVEMGLPDNMRFLGMSVDRRNRTLQLLAQDAAIDLALPALPWPRP